MSRKESLEYIRNSARKRTQLENLQRRLDYEMQEEHNYNQVGNEGPTDEDDQYSIDTKEEKTPLLKEVERIKMTLLSRLDDIDCDESDIESDNLDSKKVGIQRDEDGTSCFAYPIDHQHNIMQVNADPGSIQYSFGDASTLQTIDSTASMMEEHVMTSSDKENVLPFSSHIINDESTEGGTNPSFSTTSTWDNLSCNQHNRIYDRSTELYKLKYKPQAITNNGEHRKSRESHTISSAVSPLEDVSTTSFCVKGLVDAISDGLFFTSGETVATQDDGKDAVHAPLIGSESETSERQGKSSMLPNPRHPYSFPLENKFRKAMTQDEARC